MISMSPDRGTRSDAEYAARLIGPWSGSGGSLPDSDYGKRRRRRAALCPQEARRRGARAGRSATGVGWTVRAGGRARCTTGCAPELAGGRVVRRSACAGVAAAMPHRHPDVGGLRSTPRWARGSRPARAPSTGCTQLAGRGFRPQDCELLIDGYCGQIKRWTLAGTELLAESTQGVSAAGVSALR